VGEPQNKTMTTILLTLTAFAAAALTFVAIPVFILELASPWAKVQTDPSSGDAIGWGLVIGAPVLLAIDLGLSIGVGVIVFHRLRDRRSATRGGHGV
jgi:hypothetical protein